MKQLLIPSSIIASLLFLSSCGEDKKPSSEATAPTKISHEATQNASMKQAAQSSLKEGLVELLGKYPQLGQADGEPSIQAPVLLQDGSKLIVTHSKLIANEELYIEQNAPSELDELRKSANEDINAAMRPNSGYLLQVGLPSLALMDEDRQPQPLPAELDMIVKQLEALAVDKVFVLSQEKGAASLIEAHIIFEQNPDGNWIEKNCIINEEPLKLIQSLTAQTKLPKDACISSSQWIDQRKNQIQTLCDEFSKKSSPYIQNRETQAREAMLTRIAAIEEQERRIQDEQIAQQNKRKQHTDQMTSLLSKDAEFHGEWKRADDFGKISLTISAIDILDNAIQFVGCIYDSDLPAARLDVTGRCELDNSKESAVVNIKIYDGQYNPDVATAEVYDAQDGVLKLQLSKEGKLIGTMGCASWSKPEKNFQLHMLNPAIQAKPPLPAAEQPATDSPSELPEASDDAAPVAS